MKVQVKFKKTGKVKSMKKVYADLFIRQGVADLYEEPSAPNKRKGTAPAEPQEFLIGSNIQPEKFALNNGSFALLGDIVAHAHDRSGLTVKQWNRKSQKSREEAIQEVIDALDLKENGTTESAA